ncbi:MAG: EAL domain-containing protein [Rhodocyclaceae bacterium]|nr:EAL domain-containing protein [Rhodocyclaceae bacterium]
MAVWVVIAQQASHLRREAESDARRDVTNLSLAFAEHIRALSQSLDLSLLALREYWAEGKDRFHLAVVRQGSVAPMDYTIQIAVIDRAGRLGYSNLNPDAAPISLADREHFLVHREREQDALFISRPVLGRVSGKWSIQFTRPILDRAGHFDGVLVMSVNPDYFSRFYERVSLGPGAAVTVYRGGGEVLARAPALAAAIGADAHRFLPRGEQGDQVRLLEAVSSIDGEARTYGVRPLPGLDLSVAVGIAEADIRAAYEGHLQALALAGVLTTLVIAGFAFTLSRHLAERARATDALSRARDRDRVLVAALEAAPSGIIVTDVDARIEWANAAFTTLTGYAPWEFEGRTPAELLNSGVQPPDFYKAMWQDLLAGRAWKGELVNRRKDGSTYAEELIIAPVANELGVTTHYVGVKRDITGRRAAERRLRQESERSQLLLRMAGDGILIVDHDGRIVEVSNACSRELGYPRERLLCMRLADIDIHCDCIGRLAELQQADASGGAPITIEARFRRADGALLDVEVRAGLASLADESLVFLSFRDVTERRRLVDALAEGEQRWKFALDGSGAGVYDWDLESGALTFSDSAIAILELAPGSTVRHIKDWESRVHPMDAATRLAALEDCLSGRSDSYRCEYRYRVRGQIWKWVESRGALVRRVRDGRPMRLVGTFQDVDTARRETDQARLRARVMEALTRGKSLDSVLDMTLSGLEKNNLGLLFLLLTVGGGGALKATAVSTSTTRKLLGVQLDFEGQIIAAGSSVCMGEPLECEADDSDYWRKLVALATTEGYQVCWSEPLVVGTRRMGALVAMCDEAEDFAPPDLVELQQSAALLAIAIQKREADDALRLAASVYEASSEAVMVVDAENRIVAVNPAFTATTGYARNEVHGRDPSVLSSGRHDASFYRAMWASVTSTGSWQGEIWNRRKDGEEYIEWLSINTVHDDAGRVLRRVAVFSDVSERKAAEELIWQQANFDTVTGLPNRQLFLDRMQQAIENANRDGASIALLFIDLDHFKDVNDTLGHVAGDQLLKLASVRILSCVRGMDSVARLGGDEFTVLLPMISGPAPAERIAQAIVERMTEPFALDGESTYLTCSIGITMFPQDGKTAEALFKQADQAMYAAKNAGRNHFCWFTPAMQHDAQLRRVLANDLRHALEAGQMEVHYQPIACARTGEIVKAEALLRWHHPERGLVPPGTFIPIAEDAGLIGALGSWVFDQVAARIVGWSALRGRAGSEPLAISVNMSPRQFLAGGSDAWMEVLAAAGLSPSRIIVEITEGVLLDDRAAVIERMAAMRSRGVRFALDDFGTGYSAMAYLQRYEIDFIKIDRSFVSNLEASDKDRAITEAIIVMAHKLGMEVIAEGVEEAGQARLLTDADCDYLQGYRIGRPVSATVFEAQCLGKPGGA